MAYCPLGEGRLLNHPVLVNIARRHGVGTAAVALAFTLRLPGVISIPKSARTQPPPPPQAAARHHMSRFNGLNLMLCIRKFPQNIDNRREKRRSHVNHSHLPYATPLDSGDHLRWF